MQIELLFIDIFKIADIGFLNSANETKTNVIFLCALNNLLLSDCLFVAYIINACITRLPET